MNAGQAITAALVLQRDRDVERLVVSTREMRRRARHRQHRVPLDRRSPAGSTATGLDATVDGMLTRMNI